MTDGQSQEEGEEEKEEEEGDLRGCIHTYSHTDTLKTPRGIQRKLEEEEE